jgi:hypothetical protein
MTAGAFLSPRIVPSGITNLIGTSKGGAFGNVRFPASSRWRFEFSNILSHSLA